MLDVSENPLLNGYFDAPTSAALYTSLTAAGYIGTSWRLADLGTGGAGTVSQQAFTFGQTDVPEEPVKFLRWAQTTLGTVTNPRLLALMENVRTFQGEVATAHGWYRSNCAIIVQFRQDFGSGGSPTADVTKVAGTLPSTVDSTGTAIWKPFSVSAKLPETGGTTLGSTAGTHYLGLEFLGPKSVTFQYDLANVRVVKGGARDVSQRRHARQEELLLSRYYQSRAVWAPVSTQSAAYIGHVVPMIFAPSMTNTGGTSSVVDANGFALISSGAAAAVTAIADARIVE